MPMGSLFTYECAAIYRTMLRKGPARRRSAYIRRKGAVPRMRYISGSGARALDSTA